MKHTIFAALFALLFGAGAVLAQPLTRSQAYQVDVNSNAFTFIRLTNAPAGTAQSAFTWLDRWLDYQWDHVSVSSNAGWTTINVTGTTHQALFDYLDDMLGHLIGADQAASNRIIDAVTWTSGTNYTGRFESNTLFLTYADPSVSSNGWEYVAPSNSSVQAGFNAVDDAFGRFAALIPSASNSSPAYLSFFDNANPVERLYSNVFRTVGVVNECIGGGGSAIDGSFGKWATDKYVFYHPGDYMVITRVYEARNLSTGVNSQNLASVYCFLQDTNGVDGVQDVVVNVYEFDSVVGGLTHSSSNKGFSGTSLAFYSGVVSGQAVAVKAATVTSGIGTTNSVLAIPYMKQAVYRLFVPGDLQQ